MRPKDNPYRVESVDRAMQLLALVLDRGELSATEAAAELGVAPSTAHRILTTMRDRGFLAQDDRRLYHPGPMLGRARNSWFDHRSVIELLRPVLHKLYASIGETVHLMTLVGTDVRFIDGIEGTHGLRVGLRTGMLVPAYCSSGGKAMLAALPDREVRALHAGGLRPWPGREKITVEELLGELAQVREEGGVAYNIEETEKGVSAVGVAVLAPDKTPLVGIAVAIPSARFDDLREVVVPQLLKARDEATRLVLNHSGAIRSQAAHGVPE
ncbi:IclR family transcriptional regulator [Thermobispora bispora]|uniref:IclR family transcriptional regulator n=1 Tax=Thermobispora bispora TaxID=2006 RepID=UPI0030EAAC97